MKLINLINFLVNNPCEEPEILKIIYFIKLILKVAFIVVPIVLIILITADFIKSVTAGNEDTMKKNQKLVVKRIIYCLMIFFVLPIVNIVFSAFGTSGQEDLIEAEGASYLSCWDNAKDMETINGFEIVAKFDPSGGKVYGDSTKSCGGSSYCEISSLPNAAKKGYIFEGWSNDKCYTTTKNQKLVLNKNDKNNFIACWKEKPKEELPEEGYIPESGKSKSDSQKAAADINNSNASSFWWPIAPDSNGKPKTVNISSGWGYRSGGFHYAIDISRNEPEIIASYDGIVYLTGNDCRNTYQREYIYGVYVVLKHNYDRKTVYTIYGHMKCDSIPSNIVKDAKVTAGTKLGIMGNTGNSGGTHLHFEIREGAYTPRKNHVVNPLTYVDPKNPYPQNEGSTGDTGGSGSNDEKGYADVSKTTTMLVNEWNVIKDNNWEPSNLVKVGKNYVVSGREDTMLQKEAAEAVRKLIDAAKKDGVSLKVYSGYRSYSYQNGLGWKTNPLIAAPNATEHRTGLAVDFNAATQWGKWINKYPKSWDWLSKNAKNYGFILRFPLGCEDKTGIHSESWHWRYIGVNNAKNFYETAAESNTATKPKYEQNLQSSGDQKTDNDSVYYKYTYEEFYEFLK